MKLFGCVQFTVYGHIPIQGEIFHFKQLRVSVVNRMATRTFRENKKPQQS